jgi:tetratricopeptide (TPR) repeat protein
LAPRLREVAARYPKALSVQVLAARASAGAGGRGGSDEALAIASRAMQAFPTAAEPAEIVATALAAQGRWNEALGAGRQWKQRAPSAAGADFLVATAHLSLGDAGQAIRVVQPYLDNDPASAAAETTESTRARVLTAQALVALGKTADAEKLLMPRLAESQPCRVVTINIASSQMPDFALASHWLEAVESRIPADASAEQVAIADGWMKLARRSRVPAHQDRSRQLAGRFVEATLASPQPKAGDTVLAGMIAEQAGDLKSAEAAYNRALSLQPGNAVVMNNLAMILAGRGDAAAAERLATQAVSQDHPQRAAFYDTLATVQEKQSRLPDAARTIDAALKLDPGNIGYHIHKASILVGADKKDDARQVMRTIASVQPEDDRLSDTDRQRLRTLRQALVAGS